MIIEFVMVIDLLYTCLHLMESQSVEMLAIRVGDYY